MVLSEIVIKCYLQKNLMAKFYFTLYIIRILLFEKLQIKSTFVTR